MFIVAPLNCEGLLSHAVVCELSSFAIIALGERERERERERANSVSLYKNVLKSSHVLAYMCLNVTLIYLQTGLVQLDGEWELKEFADDYPKFEKRLAEQEPYWKIGTVKYNEPIDLSV